MSRTISNFYKPQKQKISVQPVKIFNFIKKGEYLKSNPVSPVANSSFQSMSINQSLSKAINSQGTKRIRNLFRSFDRSQDNKGRNCLTVHNPTRNSINIKRSYSPTTLLKIKTISIEKMQEFMSSLVDKVTQKYEDVK